MTESQKKLHAQQVSALKKLMSGVIIAEYGLRQLVDNTEKELKRRTKIAMTAIESMQNCFLHNPTISKERKELFKLDFQSDRKVLLAEIFEILVDIEEEGLEIILDAIKKSIDENSNS